MKKFWFQLFGLVIIILGATFLAFNKAYLDPLTSQFSKKTVRIPITLTNTKNLNIVDAAGNTKVSLKVEVASDPKTRGKGLGYRATLASGSGMLFIHETSQKYTYWMKGMEFPIDIIWISGNEIVDIIKNIQPPLPGQIDDNLERYTSTKEVNQVLETNAGYVDQNEIVIGDKINLSAN